MKLTIKNSEWLRGTGRDGRFYEGMLYEPVKKCYCVQGLLCKQNKITDGMMGRKIRVSAIAKTYNNINSDSPLRWLISPQGTMNSKPIFRASGIAIEIERINDDTETADAEKIKLLKPIFAAHGVEIEYREDL